MAEEKPAIETPKRFQSQDWYDRIEKAKRAGEQGKKAREGRPIVFTNRRSLR